MGGLDDQVLDTVGNSAVEGLLHVVDLLAVTGLDMVDDDLGSEGAADGPIRVSGLQSILDALDVGRAAAVERGAKADDQQLVLTDFIFVAGGVLAGVAGVAAEVLGVSVLTLDHFLLGVGQGIPGSLGGFALGVGVIGALLHVDGVDQVCAVLCGHLVSISFFGFLCGALADGGAFGHAVRRSGGAATASQQCGGQGQGCCHSGGLFPVDSSHVSCFLSYYNRWAVQGRTTADTKRRTPE